MNRVAALSTIVLFAASGTAWANEAPKSDLQEAPKFAQLSDEQLDAVAAGGGDCGGSLITVNVTVKDNYILSNNNVLVLSSSKKY